VAQPDSKPQQQSKQQQAGGLGDKSFWAANSEAGGVCQVSGQAFGTFSNRKHHCRFTGKVFVK
jgi:hypothetical protein